MSDHYDWVADKKTYFSQKQESLWEANFSYTLDRMGLIDMGWQFSLPGDGALLGAAVTLADGQHSGNDPRLISPRKIMQFWRNNIHNHH